MKRDEEVPYIRSAWRRESFRCERISHHGGFAGDRTEDPDGTHTEKIEVLKEVPAVRDMSWSKTAQNELNVRFTLTDPMSAPGRPDTDF